jgi:putative hydroxymethylpyrimidine transport system substrate-binding protein
MRTRISLLLALMALGGCGASSHHPASATLVLDFTPNAVHAGIYRALARHYPRQDGVALHIQVPGSSTDAAKLLLSGRAQMAILDIHDLAIARAKGQDLVAVMAVVERPLAAVVAGPAIATPRQLEGRDVGVTGVPSDTAVLDSIVAGAGGDPAKVHRITIGFNAVPDVLAGKVAAATAFWNDEGLTLASREPGAHVFRVDSYGAPAYPELVLTVARKTLRAHPAVIAGTVKALIRGYRDTIADPAASVSALTKAVPGLDRELVARQLEALVPAFVGTAAGYGDVDPARLRAWSAWEARFGIVKRAPNTSAMFDDRFVRAATGR